MKGKTINCLLLILAIIYTSNFVMGQTMRGPLVISPQINPDNTAIFRFLAPTAKEVKLDAQFGKKTLLMTKDSSGIWSVTVGPIEPDMYPYHFVVDGINVSDPNNSAIFPNEGFQNSIAEITGNTPLIHTIQNVPQGTLSYRYYYSHELDVRPVIIYTPPGYEKNTDIKYPVLYLLHGTTDIEETWTKGRHIASGCFHPIN